MSYKKPVQVRSYFSDDTAFDTLTLYQQPDQSLFTPYAPPAHHPSHVQSQYAAPGQQVEEVYDAQPVHEPVDVKTEERGDYDFPSKVDKMDPYEEGAFSI